MKEQWRLILGLIIVIIIAVFAIVNVEEVPVSFVVGVASWPLILVILGSAFLGVIISSCFAGIRIFKLKKEIQELERLIPNYDKIKARRKEEEAVEKAKREQARIEKERAKKEKARMERLEKERIEKEKLDNVKKNQDNSSNEIKK